MPLFLQNKQQTFWYKYYLTDANGRVELHSKKNAIRILTQSELN